MTEVSRKIVERFLDIHGESIKDDLSLKEKADNLERLIKTPLCRLAVYPPNYYLVEKIFRFAQAEMIAPSNPVR